MTYNLNKLYFCFTFIIFFTFFSQNSYASKENYLGSEDAKVTIIEYASMTCSHCANFHADVFPKINEKYIKTNKVKFIFRDFPLDKQALFASILARCAPKDRYFDFIKLIFETSKKWISTEDQFMYKLKNIGKMGGLNNETIEGCFKNEVLVDQVINSRTNGEKQYAITSTPSFIINEKKYTAMSFRQFEKVLDDLIE